VVIIEDIKLEIDRIIAKAGQGNKEKDNPRSFGNFLLGRGITAILAAEKGRRVTESCSGDLEHREEGEEIDRERKGERRKGK